MSNQKKNPASRYSVLLLLKEPYEMTYWKNKINSPFRRFIAAVKQWHAIHAHPFTYAK
jgi:hypothetical protein